MTQIVFKQLADAAKNKIPVLPSCWPALFGFTKKTTPLTGKSANTFVMKFKMKLVLAADKIPIAGQMQKIATIASSGEFDISKQVSRSHDRAEGINVDSASEVLPAKPAKWSDMKVRMASHARVWHSWEVWWFRTRLFCEANFHWQGWLDRDGLVENASRIYGWGWTWTSWEKSMSFLILILELHHHHNLMSYNNFFFSLGCPPTAAQAWREFLHLLSRPLEMILGWCPPKFKHNLNEPQTKTTD